MKRVFFLLFFLLVFLPLTWFFINEFEGKPPEIKVELPSVYLNKSFEMSLKVSDRGTGLRNVQVSIVQGAKEKNVLEKSYPFSGYESFFMGSQIHEDVLNIPVTYWKYGMKDGEALIRIKVTDYSWKDWNNGNKVSLEKTVFIDSKPPRIDILTRRHNVERGGSGLVIYRLFETSIKSGVKVGDNFFPGYSGMFDDKGIYSAFFALSYHQGPGAEINVTATDPAGNTASRGFYYYIRDRKFKTDVLNLSDSFFSKKMPEFDLGEKEQIFNSRENPLLEKFLYVNTSLRTENVNTLLDSVKQTEPERFWQGRFLRLPGSANRASFADHRIYRYKGKEIDRQVHLGIDLASVAMAPVPAANTGKILSTGRVGIFGNTVIIDHGFGLTSVYSHLSTILVQEGDLVQKGEIIGKSGSTGLAGGDHLHFGMAVNHVFVNPVEWWDISWIKNNILSKIEYVEKMHW